VFHGLVWRIGHAALNIHAQKCPLVAVGINTSSTTSLPPFREVVHLFREPGHQQVELVRPFAPACGLRSRTQIGDQLTIERYEPKKAPPEQGDTVLAGPPKPDDLTMLVSRGAVLPIAPQRADGERPRTKFAGKVH
jgi:hypothetical protein